MCRVEIRLTSRHLTSWQRAGPNHRIRAILDKVAKKKSLHLTEIETPYYLAVLVYFLVVG